MNEVVEGILWDHPCLLSFIIVCIQVKRRLFEEGFMADVDLSTGDSFNKKIRNGQLAQYNYILGEYKFSQCWLWLLGVFNQYNT